MQHVPVGAAPQQPADESGVYFACVPPDVPLGDLVQLFSMCGRIVDINLYKAYAKARVSKGCGIVVFATPAEAQNAIRHLRGASIWPHAREPLLLEPRLPDSHKPPKGARTHWTVQVPMLQLGQAQSLQLQVPGNATALAALQAQLAQSGVAPGIPGLLPALGTMGQQHAPAGAPQAHALQQQQHQQQQMLLWQQQQQHQPVGAGHVPAPSYGFSAPAALQGSSQPAPHMMGPLGLASGALQAAPYMYAAGMQHASMTAAAGASQHGTQAFNGDTAAAFFQHRLQHQHQAHHQDQQQQQQQQQQQYMQGQSLQAGNSERLHTTHVLTQQGLQQQQAAMGRAGLHTQPQPGGLAADWAAAHMLTTGASQPQASMSPMPGQQQQQPPAQEGGISRVLLREDSGGSRSLVRDDSGNSRLFLREGSGSGRLLLREGSGISVHSDPGPSMPVMPVERTGSGMSTLPCLMEDHPMGNAGGDLAAALASPPDLSRGFLSSFTGSFSLPTARTDSDSSTSSRFHLHAPMDMDLQRATPPHGALTTPRPLHLREPLGPSPLSPPTARPFASAAHAAAVAAAGAGGSSGPLLAPLVNVGASAAPGAAACPDVPAAAAAATTTAQATQAAGIMQPRMLPLAPHHAPLLAEHLRSLSRLAAVELQLQDDASGQPSLRFNATDDQLDLLQLLISRLL